jgi:hypothetical protein
LFPGTNTPAYFVLNFNCKETQVLKHWFDAPNPLSNKTDQIK